MHNTAFAVYDRLDMNARLKATLRILDGIVRRQKALGDPKADADIAAAFVDHELEKLAEETKRYWGV